MLNSGSPILHEGGQQAYVGWWDAVTSLARFEFKNVLKEFVWGKAHVWLYVARSQGDKILKTLSPPHSVCIELKSQLRWCCIMVCMWNRFLRPWSLEIASRWHWRQLWSTAYTFHPPQARLQRGSTLLKLGRLEQAAADFSELVCTCLYSSICITQKQTIIESGEGLGHSSQRDPYLNMYA